MSASEMLMFTMELQLSEFSNHPSWHCVICSLCAEVLVPMKCRRQLASLGVKQ